MNTLDLIIVGLIGLSAIVSFVRGFVKEVLSLVNLCAAFFVASKFYPKLAVYFTLIEQKTLSEGIAAVVLFIVCLMTGGLIIYLLNQLVQKTGLSGTDRILGVVFGLLRGVFIVAIALLFLDMFSPAPKSVWWQESELIPEFTQIIQPIFKYFQGKSSFLSGVL